MTTPTVSAMDADLARSGLSPSDMDTTPLAPVFGATVYTGYKIPYYLPDGTQHPLMYRIRHTNVAPGEPRYGQPSTEDIVKAGGTKYDATHPYLNPHILGKGGPTWSQVGQIKGKRLLIVEGEKKAVAAGKVMQCFAIGIGGCWNAMVRNDKGIFELHPVIRALLQPGDTVEVVFDGDMLTNEQVNRAAGSLRRCLLRCGVVPSFVVLPAWSGGRMGMDDWLLVQPAGTEKAAYDALPRLTGIEGDCFSEDGPSLWDWLGLLLNEGGRPLPIEQNIHLFLTKHERYVGRLWYDVVEQRIWHTLNGAPQQFTDARAFHEAAWMQRKAGWLSVRRGPVLEAFLSLSDQKALHRNPLIDDIRAAVWDGEPRLETMFIKAFGATDTPYHRAIGRNWLTSAVARALDPGCQVDTMLILEGKQGLGKSQALKILGGRWYVEVKQAIGEKDFVMAAHHGWIADIIELGAFRYADFTHIKGEITTRVDSIRAPYGRSIEDRPRRFVFVGTTNTTDYLRDDTGNRRFWPIACNPVVDVPGTDGMLDLGWLFDNRAQLLAEAAFRFDSGESWWEVDAAEAAAIQAERMERDPWDETILALLGNPANWRLIDTFAGKMHFVSTGEILNALNVDPSHQNSGLSRRIARVVTQSAPGWTPHHYVNPKKPLALANGTNAGSARGYVHPVIGGAPSTVINFPTQPNQKVSKF